MMLDFVRSLVCSLGLIAGYLGMAWVCIAAFTRATPWWVAGAASLLHFLYTVGLVGWLARSRERGAAERIDDPPLNKEIRDAITRFSAHHEDLCPECPEWIKVKAHLNTYEDVFTVVMVASEHVYDRQFIAGLAMELADGHAYRRQWLTMLRRWEIPCFYWEWGPFECVRTPVYMEISVMYRRRGLRVNYSRTGVPGAVEIELQSKTHLRSWCVRRGKGK